MKRFGSSQVVFPVVFAVLNACSFAAPEGSLPGPGISRIECIMEGFEPDDATKVMTEITGSGSTSSLVSTWEEGDMIGVFPDMGGDQVSFTVASGAGTSNCTFDGEGWGLISAARYSAYYPYHTENYGGSDAWKNIKVSYVGQSQSEKGVFGVGKYDYMACTNAVPSFDEDVSGTCTFTFKHLGAILVLDVKFPTAAFLSTLELVCNGDLFTEAGTVDLSQSQSAASITSTAKGNTLSLDLGGMSVMANETVRFYMMAAPANLTSEMPTVRATTTTGMVMTKKLTSSYNLKAGRAYSLSASLEITEDEPDGLPQTIHNGDRILVTNGIVEQFLTEVHYPVRDYSYTGVLDYPVAPGESDIPPSFTIRWYVDSQGDVVVRLWEDGWSTECTFNPLEGKHWIVTNLRPNAHYSYQVSSAVSGTVLNEGSFDTYGHLHQVFFESQVRNARDLGGWKTRNGKTVKYRKLYRGGRMSPKHLTEEGRQALLTEGIRAQLDLRGSDKISSCAFGSQYPFFAPGLAAGYLNMLGPDGEKTKECFEFIVNCLRDDKPVYFNCSAGRDRTGTMAMLLLGVLDVPEGDISQEYELSLFAPVSWSITENETTVQTRLVSYKTTTTHLWNLANGGTFAKGVETCLLSLGVSQTDIDDFRAMMLE